MKREIQLGIFLVVFLVVYFLLNYFVINSYFSYFFLEKDIIFYLTVFFLTISYPLAMVIEKKFASKTAKYFYIFSSVWMGFFFISLFVILTFYLIKIFFNNPLINYLIFPISLTLTIYSIINALNIKIRRVKLEMNKLKKNTRIVQLSDIHMGSINRENYLKKLVDMANKQKPDFVVLTGDLVDGSAPLNKNMINHINEIKVPVYYIIGNHEIYEGLEKFMHLLEKSKMKILKNSKAKFREINIIGFDHYEGNKEINEIIDKTKFDKNKMNILLYHAPSLNVEKLSKKNIDLHLCGHTHGGQIFPFNLFVRLAFPYVRGLHSSKDGNSHVYVSEGSGTWGPPMRLGSKSEITVIDLLKKK